ncbi:MAG: hypothetical protein COB02_02125 [Candidatus Cloacimonadota bacterium]|nr:MAG: hypothetical protein COB02_02125 [Candidatus Cloacimonadota bacterium]
MKKKESNIIFNVLSIFFAFVLLIGCSDTGIQDTLISPSVNGFSVIRGVVTDTSVRLQSISKSTSVSNSNINTASIGVDMALMTDKGLILQRRSFQKRNNEGNFEFIFEGEFPKEALRIRVYEVSASSDVYDVAIGTASSKDQSITLKNYKEAALATRYLEQSHSYEDLKTQSVSNFLDTLDDLILKKVHPLENKDLFIKNLNRLGVDEQGKFTIFPSNYLPSKKRAPNKPTSWEATMFNKEIIIDEPEKEVFTLKKNKRLVNFIYQALRVDDSKVLYDSRLFKQKKVIQNSNEIKVIFRMIRLPKVEQLEYINKNLSLLFINANHRKQVSIKEFSPQWKNTRDLVLTINLNQYIYFASEELGIYLKDALPTQEDEILQILAGIHLEVNF